MKTSKELERKETLLDREMKLFGDKMEQFEIEIRDRLNKLEQEVEALVLYTECNNPPGVKTYRDIRARVFEGAEKRRGI
ncbi:MAG: hypothetical protein A2Y02_02630 [Omnitrophica bacterium GWA2_52_12]|nr:MAG: hypothetical protein A2Y02_02630 [Omnitrophica bacterium GWA2_52_12]